MRDRAAHTGSPGGGRTHWRRSALLFVPCTLAVAASGVALAEGSIAASFAVQGTAFKVSRRSLRDWRRSRPFRAAVWGVAGGIFFLVQPDQRMFVSVVTAMEAGQVLVDAETVEFSGLSAHSHDRQEA
ncbi:hypothetical protein ACWD3J_28970 [Streptomyces sp. NPDC002755]|uniref:hypothetical protein n=1 Tax=Streptomyces sp. NPDC002884 TaxID=3154544 RepID=UPI00331941F8